MQHFDESGSDGAKLVQMMQRELAKDLFSVTRKLNQHLSFVSGSPESNEKTPLHEPIDEAYGAVVLQLHSLRQYTDRWSEAFGQPFKGK